MEKLNPNTLILVGAILLVGWWISNDKSPQPNPPQPEPTDVITEEDEDDSWLPDPKEAFDTTAIPPIDFKHEIPKPESKFQRLLPKVQPVVDTVEVTPLILEIAKSTTNPVVKGEQTVCLIEVAPKDFPCDRCTQAVEMLRATLRNTNWKLGYDDSCDFKIVESEKEGWPRFRYFKDGIECGLIEGFHGMPEEIKAIVIKHPACSSAWKVKEAKKETRPTQITASFKESEFVPPAPPSEVDSTKADEIIEELKKTNQRLSLLEDNTAYSKPAKPKTTAQTYGGGYNFGNADGPEFVYNGCGGYTVTKSGSYGGIYYGAGERWRFNSPASTVAAYTTPVYTYAAGTCGGGGGNNPYAYSYNPGWGVGAGVNIGGFGVGIGGGGGGRCVNGMCYR